MTLYGFRGLLNLARARRGRDGARGQILVLFTLVMVLLMALTALVIDVGLLRTDGARLQNALDAGALAAGQSLPANNSNVAAVRTTAATFAQDNFPGLATPTITFACLIGGDANGLPRMSDMPSICKVSLLANDAGWRCTGSLCWAPCDPSTVSTDVCNTVTVADSVTRPYSFGRLVGINSRSTGTQTASVCTGACGGPPTTPVDVVLVIDRTQSMAGDADNLRNAAFAMLKAYDPSIHHVALGMLGPSSEITPCASGGYGKVLVTGLTAPGIESVTSDSNDSGTDGAPTLQISKPNGTTPGDVLVAGITFDGGTDVGTMSLPTSGGWLPIARRDNGTDVGQATYYKVATATDAGNGITSYTWTFSTTERASGGIIRVSGADISDPIDRSSANSGSGTTMIATGVTTTTDETTLVGFFSSDSDGNINMSGGSSLTERFGVTNANASGPRTVGATLTQGNLGGTGDKTATGSDAQWVAQLIALRPAPVESYDTNYPVAPYDSSLKKWIPVGLTGTSDAEVIDAYVDADGNLNTSSDLVRTINCVQEGHLYAGTDLATPMDFAWRYLDEHARDDPEVKRGIVFESDGTPQTKNFTCAQATTAANAAKAAIPPIEVFTIGFSLEASGNNDAPKCPDDDNRTALTQLASMATDSSSTSTTQCDANENTDGDHFFCKPAGTDLTAVFKAAAVQLSGGSRLVQLYPWPIVTAVSPNTNGATTGGATVTISGKYFTEAYSVTFGGTQAATFSVLDPCSPPLPVDPCGTSIRAVSPAGAANTTVDIQVSTPGGSSKIVSADRYTYGAP